LIRPTADEVSLVDEGDCAKWRELGRDERRRIQGYTDEATDRELARLSVEALEGHNWDPTTFEVACNLFELCKAPWTPLDVAEIEKDIRDAVPDFDREGWNQARLDRVLESARKRVFENLGCRPFPLEELGIKPAFGKELDSFFVDVAGVGQMEDPSFLWTGKILAHELSLLVGDGGMGKGLLCAYLIKNVGMGTLEGDMKGRPIRSLFVSHEEVYNIHTLPRLRAVGMSEKALSEYVRFGDLNKLVSDTLTLDKLKLDALLTRCKDRGIELVILDPIQSFLDLSVDSNNPQQIQRALTPIGIAAHNYRISIIGIHHIIKGQSTRASHKVSGTMAWRNTARSVLYLEKDPEGMDGYDRVITALKNNYAEEAKPIRYRTEPTYVTGLVKSVGRIVLGEVVDDTSADDIAEAHTLTARERSYDLSQRNKCEVLIIKMLTDSSGGLEPRTIKYAISRRLNVTEKTVARAFNELKSHNVVETTGTTGVAGVWRITDKEKAAKYRNMIDPGERFDPNQLIV
jgi:archaellum biogenesis ATPase FlaH